jgi:hypothetical protein
LLLGKGYQSEHNSWCAHGNIQEAISYVSVLVNPMSNLRPVSFSGKDRFAPSEQQIPIPTNSVASTTSGVKLMAQTETGSALAVTGSAVKS